MKTGMFQEKQKIRDKGRLSCFRRLKKAEAEMSFMSDELGDRSGFDAWLGSDFALECIDQLAENRAQADV
jgi:hypothetical protein